MKYINLHTHAHVHVHVHVHVSVIRSGTPQQLTVIYTYSCITLHVAHSILSGSAKQHALYDVRSTYLRLWKMVDSKLQVS